MMVIASRLAGASGWGDVDRGHHVPDGLRGADDRVPGDGADRICATMGKLKMIGRRALLAMVMTTMPGKLISRYKTVAEEDVLISAKWTPPWRPARPHPRRAGNSYCGTV